MACYPVTNIPAILHPFCSAKNVEKDLLPSSEIVEQLLILLFSLDSKFIGPIRSGETPRILKAERETVVVGNLGLLSLALH